MISRQLPCVALSSEHLDTWGKTFALCWQLFLSFGPTVGHLRAFLLACRGLVTDMGTERLLADRPDILKEVYEWMNPRFRFPPREIGAHAYLFPKALAAPGWQHAIDSYYGYFC